MREKLRERFAEWALVRRTETLGDVVDEAQFLSMMPGVSQKSLRNWRCDGIVHGILLPDPIFRPDGLKPIWLKREAEKFAREYKAVRNARR